MKCVEWLSGEGVNQCIDNGFPIISCCTNNIAWPSLKEENNSKFVFCTFYLAN